MLLTGTAHPFAFAPHSRFFSYQVMPFSEICDLMMVRPFDAGKLTGEQRVQSVAHCRKLLESFTSGQHTPTPMTASVPLEIQPRVRKTQQPDGSWHFSLELEKGERLAHTDGGHRRRTLEDYLAYLEGVIEKEQGRPTPDQEVITRAEVLMEDIAALQFPVLIYLDGNPQEHFLDLQRGKSVDRTTLLVMETASDHFDDPAYKTAIAIAQALHRDRKCEPFFGQIRFDSAGNAAIKLATLMARGSSDLSTSLIGLAKVGEFLNTPPQKLAAGITRVFECVNKRYSGLLERGRVLTTIANNGTMAASTMWVGLGILVAYAASQSSLDDAAKELAEVCYETLSEVQISGSFSSADKRIFMGRLAQRFFSAMALDRLHEGVPVDLVRTLSATAFRVSKLKKS